MRSILLTLLLISVAHADVPNVTLSPDNIAESPIISADISKVVLYGDSDRICPSTQHRNTFDWYPYTAIPKSLEHGSPRLHPVNANGRNTTSTRYSSS